MNDMNALDRASMVLLIFIFSHTFYVYVYRHMVPLARQPARFPVLCSGHKCLWQSLNWSIWSFTWCDFCIFIPLLRVISTGIWFPWASIASSVNELSDGVLKQTSASSLKDCMTQCMNTNITMDSSCDYVFMSNTTQHNRCTLFSQASGQSGQSFDSGATPIFSRSPLYRGW